MIQTTLLIISIPLNTISNPEPIKDKPLRLCLHKIRLFLIIYKYDKSNRLLCKSCYEDPDFVNDSAVDVTFNIETGETLS